MPPWAHSSSQTLSSPSSRCPIGKVLVALQSRPLPRSHCWLRAHRIPEAGTWQAPILPAPSSADKETEAQGGQGVPALDLST